MPPRVWSCLDHGSLKRPEAQAQALDPAWLHQHDQLDPCRGL